MQAVRSRVYFRTTNMQIKISQQIDPVKNWNIMFSREVKSNENETKEHMRR